MTALARVFDYEDGQVRILLNESAPWFVIADVCRAVGLSNPTMAASRLDSDDLSSAEVIDGMGRTQQARIVNEPGLYDLIFMSRKLEARAFKRWITHEVLPAIRETGRYEIEVEAQPRLPQSYAEALRELASTVEERDEAKAQLAIAAPKADYVDGFVNPDDASLIRVFAAQLGVGEKALRAWLIDHKVIYRRTVGQRWSNSKHKLVPEYEWLAYGDHRPWFKPVDQPNAPRLHNGQTATTLYVTPVGKVAIRRLLMKHPIEPHAA